MKHSSARRTRSSCARSRQPAFRRGAAQTPSAKLPAPPSGNREPASSSATAILWLVARLIRVQNTARNAGTRPAPTAPHHHHRDRDQPTESQQAASESARRDVARERLGIRDRRRAAPLVLITRDQRVAVAPDVQELFRLCGTLGRRFGDALGLTRNAVGGDRLTRATSGSPGLVEVRAAPGRPPRSAPARRTTPTDPQAPRSAPSRRPSAQTPSTETPTGPSRPAGPVSGSCRSPAMWPHQHPGTRPGEPATPESGDCAHTGAPMPAMLRSADPVRLRGGAPLGHSVDPNHRERRSRPTEEWT